MDILTRLDNENQRHQKLASARLPRRESITPEIYEKPMESKLLKDCFLAVKC